MSSRSLIFPTLENHFLKKLFKVTNVFFFCCCVFSGDPKEKRYFFCKTSDINHATANVSGYWMPNIKNNVNAHELILATWCNHPIGFKKSFVFYELKDQRRSGSKTSWILHQYRVLYPLPIKVFINMVRWLCMCIFSEVFFTKRFKFL